MTEHNESMVRLAVFVGILLVMMGWELLAPRRQVPAHRLSRWSANFGIQVINVLLLRLVFPGAAVGIAAGFEAQGIGLLRWLAIDGWLGLMLALIILDLAIYAQHVAAHYWPWFWRLHRMHHADTHLDVSSGLRFHPLEILVSMGWKAVVLAISGASVEAVLLFEVILNGTALFNHGNVRIPLAVDRIVRRFIVTPDMHRVHHSVVVAETNSNFGFNLSLWDRLFKTYRDQPAAGHDNMIIGLPQFREARDMRLDRMLWQPFR